MPRKPKPLTGKDLALAAAADFQEFYLSSARMKVDILVRPIRFPALWTNASGSRIAIPQDMADQVIDGPDRLHLHLLMLGHEIAHLVHEHGDAKDLAPAEDLALEYWADFYGAKVMMMLVTYGSRIANIYRTYFPGCTEFEGPMESIGRAVGVLVRDVYNDHPRYPRKLLRVGLITNGICSFLRLDMKKADLIWYYSVHKRVCASEPVRELILFHGKDVEDGGGPIAQVRRWHRETQGDRPAISQGLHPIFLPYLHTTFDQTDEELAASRAMRQAELREYGYDL